MIPDTASMSNLSLLWSVDFTNEYVTLPLAPVSRSTAFTCHSQCDNSYTLTTHTYRQIQTNHFLSITQITHSTGHCLGESAWVTVTNGIFHQWQLFVFVLFCLTWNPVLKSYWVCTLVCMSICIMVCVRCICYLKAALYAYNCNQLATSFNYSCSLPCYAIVNVTIFTISVQLWHIKYNDELAVWPCDVLSPNIPYLCIILDKRKTYDALLDIILPTLPPIHPQSTFVIV